MSQLIVCNHSRLHIWLVLLMIEPEFNHNHNLKVVVDILDLVSLVLIKIIFYLLAADVVELADLVQSVSRNALESFTVLLWGQES